LFNGTVFASQPDPLQLSLSLNINAVNDLVALVRKFVLLHKRQDLLSQKYIFMCGSVTAIEDGAPPPVAQGLNSVEDAV